MVPYVVKNDDASAKISRRSRIRQSLGVLLQISVAVGILAWLVFDLHRSDPLAVSRFISRPKHVGLLLASTACLLAANCLVFFRWYLLVRALDIPFTVRQAFRLGFLGYIFNFVGPGPIGGDLLKAYSLARHQQSRRVEAAATIFVDRAVGLLSLLVVASLAIQVSGLSMDGEFGMLLQSVQGMTLVGLLVVAILMLPWTFSRRFMGPLLGIPLIGIVIARTSLALSLYRRRWFWLIPILGLSLFGHFLVAVTIHLADRAIYPTTPRLAEHFVISPLASAATAAPLPGGLGTYELAMRYLYDAVPRQPTERGQGLAVAFCFRLISLAVAAVGGVYYLVYRKEVATIAAEIEHTVDRVEQAVDLGE